MYDIIGDIHGELDALKDLLQHLGYHCRDGTWRHPGRQALFLGDLIDRGAHSREVVAMVRSMVESGQARCVMGNHEFNAIAYHTPHPARPGEFLREHSKKNHAQHSATLRSYAGHDQTLASDLAWFRGLPFWLDLGDLRLIHAAWLPEHMAIIERTLNNRDTDWPERYPEAFDESTPLGSALEAVLKGVEQPLPKGVFFYDKDGNKRTKIRTRWWQSRPGLSWRSLALGSPDIVSRLPDTPTDDSVPVLAYPPEAPPVFVGHYWLRGDPIPLADNVFCLDYSVAKGGKLVAWRWRDRETRGTSGFEWITPKDGRSIE